MLCRDCEHFKIIQQPLKVGRDVYDCGVAECKKHNLIVEFTHKGKFKWLSCIEDEQRGKE